ncbi:MAG TPA: phage baseplate assembly protein [Nevskia sp.]|nr:phage baseplate assembly protein [Nevskia sp.]
MSLVDRIRFLVRYLVGRGRIQLVDDSGNTQRVQVVFGPFETETLRRIAEFGLASNPPAGTDGIALFIDGDRTDGVVIGTNNQALRPKNLQPGEVMVYDGNGQSVYLSRTGIVVNGGGNPINVNNAPVVNINGAQQLLVQASVKARFETPLLEVTGDIIDNVGGLTPNTRSMAQMRVIYNGHHHQVANVQTGLSTILSNVPDALE